MKTLRDMAVAAWQWLFGGPPPTQPASRPPRLRVQVRNSYMLDRKKKRPPIKGERGGKT